MVIASDWLLAVHEPLEGRPLFFNSNPRIEIDESQCRLYAYSRGNAFALVVGRLDSPSTGSRGRIDLLNANTTFSPLKREIRAQFGRCPLWRGSTGQHFSREGDLDLQLGLILLTRCLGPVVEKRISGNNMSSTRRGSYKKDTRQDSHELSEPSQSEPLQ